MRNAYGQAATGFIATSVSSQWWPTLPSFFHVCTIVIITYLAMYRFNVTRYAFFVIGGGIGAIWMLSVGHWYASWQLPKSKIQQDVTIVGKIESVKASPTATKMTIALQTVDVQPWRARVRVSWYRPDKQFITGQIVSLCVRLKPSHGLQNPHGFDYWRWQIGQQIIASGYVVKCDNNRLLVPTAGLRHVLLSRLSSLTLPGERWLRALMLADRQQFTQQDWSLLKQTGLTHLFALSGLHMGSVFLFSLFAAKGLMLIGCYCFRLRVSKPSVFQTLILAAVLSGGFVYLCNAPLTIFRAWIAMLVIAMCYCFSAKLTALQALLMVAVVCVVFFPFSIYGLSLYLSFAAVSAIVFLLWRYPMPANAFAPKLVYVVKIQLCLSLLMGLVSAASFNTVPWIAPLVNLIAVPIVTLLIVPMCLLGLALLLVLPEVAFIVLYPVGLVLELGLGLLQQAPIANSEVSFPISVWLSIGALMLLVCLPHFKLKPWLAMGCCGALVLHAVNKPISGWQLHVFDVGQGSAMLISSRNQHMLVDTGPGYASGFTMAEAVIAPFLNANNIRLPIQGVLTHTDNDHAGGAEWLQQHHYIQHWRRPFTDCYNGKHWQLGDLRVEAIWPISRNTQAKKALSKNNASCVLLISDGKTRLLIPGDIEVETELALLHQNINLSVDILIAPHHGSKSSSSPAFIQAVSPEHVVFTTGYLNRWLFPHPNVVARYKQLDATTVNTATNGYVRFDIQSSEKNSKIKIYRWQQDLSKRWYKSLSPP